MDTREGRRQEDEAARVLEEDNRCTVALDHQPPGAAPGAALGAPTKDKVSIGEKVSRGDKGNRKDKVEHKGLQ